MAFARSLHAMVHAERLHARVVPHGHRRRKKPKLFVWFGLCVLGLCVFVFLLVFGVLFCVVSVCFVVMTCDREQDYVSVLHQFTFEATLPQTAYA